MLKFFLFFCILSCLTSCAQINKITHDLGVTENLDNLTQEEKVFYKANKKYLKRKEWSKWVFEADKSKRDTYIQSKSSLIEENKLKIKTKEYFNCAYIWDDKFAPSIRVTIHDEKDCRKQEGKSNWLYTNRNTFAFPRSFISKKNKNISYDIYLQVSLNDWSFFKSFSYIKDGNPTPLKKLNQIDSTVLDGNNVREMFQFNLTKKELIFFSKSKEGMEVKLFGKRGDHIFKIKPSLFQDILKVTDDYVSGKLRKTNDGSWIKKDL